MVTSKEQEARDRFAGRYREERVDVVQEIERRVIGGDWGANGDTMIAQADGLADYIRLCRGTWIREWDSYRDELVALYGEAEFDRRQQERNVQLQAIDDGGQAGTALLHPATTTWLRSLPGNGRSGRPPQHGRHWSDTAKTPSHFSTRRALGAQELLDAVDGVLAGMSDGAILAVFTDDPTAPHLAADRSAIGRVDLIAVIPHGDRTGTTLTFRRAMPGSGPDETGLPRF